LPKMLRRALIGIVVMAVVVTAIVVAIRSVRTRGTTRTAVFVVEPGGRDVTVTIAGRRARAAHLGRAGNLYVIHLPLGRQEIRIHKPGYRSERHVVVVRVSGEELYPIFPPLEPETSVPAGQPNSKPPSEPRK